MMGYSQIPPSFQGQSLQSHDRLSVNLLTDPTLLIGHELRTPLTSIRGFLGLLHAGQFGELSREGQQLLAIALNNTNRLTRLANAIEHETATSIILLSQSEIEQLQLENDLYQAVFDEQFHLVYQPIIKVDSEQIMSFEALIRWQHPTRGTILPTVFIPLAERTGLIHQLGLWVLQKACHQLALWQQQFPAIPPISISVNLSGLQLLQSDLLQQVQQVLQETNIAPNSLKLEITETVIIENQELATHTIAQLKAMGVQVYIDDFGIGYSSLARLQDLPIDALKIDRSFIHLKRWDISETVIKLASKLGLDVIAEGVETSEDLMRLKDLGCQQMQGYFFSKPINTAAATHFLASYASS